MMTSNTKPDCDAAELADKIERASADSDLGAQVLGWLVADNRKLIVAALRAKDTPADLASVKEREALAWIAKQDEREGVRVADLALVAKNALSQRDDLGETETRRRLEYMEAKYGKIDWDADAPVGGAGT